MQSHFLPESKQNPSPPQRLNVKGVYVNNNALLLELSETRGYVGFYAFAAVQLRSLSFRCKVPCHWMLGARRLIQRRIHGWKRPFFRI